MLSPCQEEQEAKTSITLQQGSRFKLFPNQKEQLLLPCQEVKELFSQPIIMNIVKDIAIY